MKHAGWFAGMILAWFAIGSAAVADVPHLIRYQGTAVDSKGVPLEGPYNLTFRLYDAETAGNLIWQEPQSNVPVSKGRFSVLLGQGAGTPLNVDWSKPLWLSIQVNTDPELAPRQRITSVPLAITAERLAIPVTTSTITDDANSLVPSGAILMVSSASCPTGYTRLATLDGKFLVGGTTFNAAAGGSDTLNLAHSHGGSTGSHALTVAEIPSHTHSTPAHTHSIPTNSAPPSSVTTRVNAPNVSTVSASIVTTGNPPGTPEGGGTSGATGGDGGHTHTISSDLSLVDNRPAFATVLLCQKN